MHDENPHRETQQAEGGQVEVKTVREPSYI